MNRMLAVLCASLLLCAPLARAQDDDMPDGDVDIVEKPKKKDDKKAPPKKEEKKKEQKKEEKKEEKKKEPPPEEKKKDDKPKAPIDDDSDILTVPADEKKAAPKPADKPADKTPDKPDEDDDEGGSRLISTDAPASVIDDDEPPPRASTSRSTASPVASPIDDGPMDDEDPPPPPTAEHEGDREGERPAVATIETKPEVPGEAEDGASGWVIAGATGGGLVLLAGAVAGTWFLVDALSPKVGSLTVTPH
ncbi:MAG: hypothetical protein IT383_05440 [Deltaproteobacteria bacterium]|nr:hypothetical protein [Deltaproteobacteria bacterium]